jgi:hypothetical protein
MIEAVSRRERWLVALLALGALAVRLLVPSSSPNMWDSASYLSAVRDLLEEGRWGRLPLDLNHPLYVLLLAGATWLSGGTDPEGPAQVVSALASTVGAFPLHVLAARFLPRASLRLLAVGLWLWLPMVWWFGLEIMSDGPCAALILVAAALAGRRPALSGLAWGAAFLTRFTAVAFLPLVVLAPRRPRRCAVALAAAAALPALYHAIDLLFLQPDGTPLVQLSAVNAGTRAMEPGWVAKRLGFLALHLAEGATIPALLVAAMGVVLLLREALRREPGARDRLAFLALAVLPYAAMLVVAPPRAVRLLLPLAPAVALLAARGTAPIPVPLAATILGAALLVRGVPVVRLLHARENVLKAHAVWFAEHTPPGSLLLSSGAESFVNHYARGRPTMQLEARPPSWANPVGGTEMERRVREALGTGQRVFVSNEPGLLPYLDDLDSRFRLVERGRLPGARLRNREDPGFVTMDLELMSRTEDAVFWEVQPGPGPRRLVLEAPASVARGGSCVIRLSGPAHAGRLYAVAAAFTSVPGFQVDGRLVPLGRDDLFSLSADHPEALGDGFRGALDAAGRAEATLRVPSVAPGVTVFFGALTVDETGLRGIADAVPIRLE